MCKSSEVLLLLLHNVFCNQQGPRPVGPDPSDTNSFAPSSSCPTSQQYMIKKYLPHNKTISLPSSTNIYPMLKQNPPLSLCVMQIGAISLHNTNTYTYKSLHQIVTRKKKSSPAGVGISYSMKWLFLQFSNGQYEGQVVRLTLTFTEYLIIRQYPSHNKMMLYHLIKQYQGVTCT